MIMLDDSTALAFDTDDLSEAVSSDNGIDTVYLGADITLENAVTIYPAKLSLVIDGTYEGIRHTFTDISSTSYTQTLGVRATSGIDLTIQNIDLIGRNYFGIPYISELVNTDNVKVRYNNVTFTGLQLAFNQRGLTCINDCDITITGSPSSQVQEAGQICKLEIGGVTTINKTNTDHAVFWFYGSSTRLPYMKILSGASVTITTANYFMYEYQPPDYIIEPEASLTLNTYSGISYDSSHAVASFELGRGAVFNFTQTANPRSAASIYLNSTLTVGEDASFYMKADFSNNNALIRFTSSSGGLYLNSCASFVLYNKGTSSALPFYFVTAIPFAITGNQVNVWSAATEFPLAGTIDDEPGYSWHRPTWGVFTLSGTASNSSTTVTYNDFTQDELDQLPPLSLLQLRSFVVFSSGILPLVVNPVSSFSLDITGFTAKDARVRVVYVEGGDSPESDADDTGFFIVSPPDPAPFVYTVTVYTNTPFLLVYSLVTVQDGGLSIHYAPSAIKFIISPISTDPVVLLPRENPEDTVIIWDERDDKTPWTLWASIDSPLKTAENDVLVDSVVYADDDGILITLSTTPQPVYSADPAPQIIETTIQWPINRGVLARITNTIRSGRRYEALLFWQVLPQGEIPDE